MKLITDTLGGGGGGGGEGEQQWRRADTLSQNEDTSQEREKWGGVGSGWEEGTSKVK